MFARSERECGWSIAGKGPVYFNVASWDIGVDRDLRCGRDCGCRGGFWFKSREIEIHVSVGVGGNLGSFWNRDVFAVHKEEQRGPPERRRFRLLP